ncbi:MAG: bifunctional phosphoribosylaminoimidazolecarboxamide formyltransferase/IMP cyclohydrolase [Flavobacteriales bacterium]|nr:bifunctional phosphoribosylaminoimidazolecarboxamide formyltransferase/IMP cyclohydrolase [Flavobacteriales bacterium]
MKKINTALISVYSKDGLKPIVKILDELGVNLISTGGTQTYLEQLGVKVQPVEEITGYPSILGGRVKTLHPGIFGGILYRREQEQDVEEITKFSIPSIDLIIVDLYPFEETLKQGGTESEIIEKIDIGGVSLIRAAAKNYKDTLVVSNQGLYSDLLNLLNTKKGSSETEDRKFFAAKAFETTQHYDNAIQQYFNSIKTSALRYGENPHQEAYFTGNLDRLFKQLNGKELSYNNLLDIESALLLVQDFNKEQNAFAIIKHNNACGMAIGSTVKESYEKALAADPVSAFGGILCTNQLIDLNTATRIHDLFFEVLMAPGYEPEAFKLLTEKKNRIILQIEGRIEDKKIHRSLLNGFVTQDRDQKTESSDDLRFVTKVRPDASETEDLLMANILVKHTKSNAIILVKDKQLLASGTGQTSRVDALQQAIHKAKHFGFDLKGACMASDAFFPFPDCVEIANQAGIDSIIQPGGSIKDQLSIDYCDEHNMKMVMTGFRHFKH